MDIEAIVRTAQTHHLSLTGFAFRDLNRGLIETGGEVLFYRGNTIASRTVTDLRDNLRPVMPRRLFIIIDCSMLEKPSDFHKSEDAMEARRNFEYAQIMFRNIIDDCQSRNASLILLGMSSFNQPLGNRLMHLAATQLETAA